MPRSENQEKKDELGRLLLKDGRYFDQGIQFRIFDSDPGKPAKPAELLPEIYGGIYDRVIRRYIAPPTDIRQVSIARAHVEAVMDDTPGVVMSLMLGAPGSGKSEFCTRRCLRKIYQRPNTTYGLIGPTDARRRVLLDKIIDQFLRPWGNLDREPSEKKKLIWTMNGCILFVGSAAIPSKRAGSALQGLELSEGFIDELQSCDPVSVKEMATRGRNAGLNYRVNASATNQRHLPEFRRELDRCKRHPETHRVYRVKSSDNPWVDPEYYTKLVKDRFNERDWKALIDVEDIPPESLVYFAFSIENNLRKRPPDSHDITEDVLHEFFGVRGKYLLATDFGRVVNYTGVLRAFRDPVTGKRKWWVVDEVLTVGELIERHAQRIKERFYPGDCVLVGDPHINDKDSDKTGFNVCRKAGFPHVFRATTGHHIAIEERVSMMNALFRDANGDSHLFIDADDHGEPRVPYLVDCLYQEERQLDGSTEGKKDGFNDHSHGPCAIGYGLHRAERVRASVHMQLETLYLK
jgi:hypothetical protein